MPSKERQLDDESNAPMMAVFGGMFALMLVFLLIVNIFSESAVRERLQDTAEDGLYRIQAEQSGFGYVVIVFPGTLRIVETGEGIPREEICEPGSAYRNYAERIYSVNEQQLLFFILEGSIPVMAEARNCLARIWPEREINIGWVIADNEFLKSVTLDDIPSYIRDYAETTTP